MNEHLSKDELKKKCTLDSIKEDYRKYGYLEDYQVEYLMEQYTAVIIYLEEILENKQSLQDPKSGKTFFGTLFTLDLITEMEKLLD